MQFFKEKILVKNGRLLRLPLIILKSEIKKTAKCSQLVHPEEIESPTFRSVDERSIQLSYGCINSKNY